MPQRSHRWYWILFGLLVVLGLQHACQKDNPVRPEPSADLRIELTADPRVAGPNEPVHVQARVVQGPGRGTPVPGATVEFAEVPLPPGTSSKREAVTDAAGIAEAGFAWDSPGSRCIGAKVVGTSVKEYVTFEVILDSTTLEVSTPEGTRLPVGGTSELRVSILATAIPTAGAARAPLANLRIVLAAGDQFIDANGNGVYDPSEQVAADRNGDGLFTAEGTLPAYVTTDENGIASFRYHAGTGVGPVYLRITGITGNNISHEITLDQFALVRVVTLGSETREMLADGVSQTVITASVQEWINSPGTGWALSPAPHLVLYCTAGEPFTDSDLDGYHDPAEDFEDLNGNGLWDPLGSVPSSIKTDTDGKADLAYTAGTRPGEVTIRVTTAAGEFGTWVLRLLSVSPAGSLDVAFDPPLPVPVYADGAAIARGFVTVKDANRDPLAGKRVTIVAGECFRDVNLDGSFTPGTDVLLDDADGNGSWTSAGTVTLDGTGLTGGDGRVGFALRVGTTPMRVCVVATVDGQIAGASFDLMPPLPVCSIEVRPIFETMTVLGGGGVTCNTLVATLLACDRLPAPAGTIVRFCLTQGPGGGEHLENAIAECVDALTDAEGKAVAVLYSGTGSGWVKVIASSGTASGILDIFIEPGASLAVSIPDGLDLPADGVTDRDICVTATGGTTGAPRPGIPLVFTAGDQFIDADGDGLYDQGEVVPAGGDRNGNGRWDSEGSLHSGATTDAQGRACFAYRAGSFVGPVFLRITGGGVFSEITLQQHSVARDVTLEATPRALLADGVSQATVTVSVKNWAQAFRNVPLRCTAGEPFTDVDGDGLYDPAEAFVDLDGNGQWDPIGSVVPSFVTTGPAGTVNFTYTAGSRPGTVTIRATATPGGESGTVELALVSGPPPERVVVELNPPIPDPCFADGATTIRGEVTVFGLGDERLAGLPVRIAAGEHFEDVNTDGVFTPGTDVLLNDADNNGTWTSAATVTLDGSGLTVADGKIGFALKAGLVPMQSWVHATVGGVFAEARLDLVAPLPVCAVTMAPTFETMTILDGGGVTCNTLVANLLTCDGLPAPAGTIARFCLTSGPGGGEHLENAIVGCVDAAADADGKAVAVLYSGTKSGWIRVTVASGTASSFIEIFLEPGATRLAVVLDLTDPPYYAGGVGVIRGSVTATNLTGGAAAGKLVTVVAGERFTDANADGAYTPGIDRLLNDSDRNETWTSAGTVTVAGRTDADGKASFDIAVGRVPMQAWVHAAVDGVTADAPFDLLALPSVCLVTMEPTSETMTVIGGGGVICNTLVATCRTSDDLPAPAGLSVRFCLTAGPGGGERLENALAGCVDGLTDGNGKARAVLYSGTRSGLAQVSVQVCNANGAHTIYIGPGSAASVTCAADSLQVAPGSQCQIRTWVYDTAHNPVADGTRVRFSADKGIVRPAEAATTNGMAVAIFTVLPGDAGAARITATSSGASGGILQCTSDVQIRGDGGSDPASAAFLTCAADSSQMAPGNQCRVRAWVSDASRNPVADGTPVRFTVDEGVVQGADGPGVSYTHAGVAEASFTAPATGGGGVAHVLASTPDASGGTLLCTSSIQIHLGGGSDPVTAAFLTCEADSSQLAPGNRCLVRTRVFDAAHNPVADGTPVQFTVDEGVVQGTDGPGVSYAQDGVAEAIFTAPSTSIDGVANVLASTPSASGGTLQCTSSIQISGGSGASCSVTLVPDLPEIAVRGTGATEQTLLRARVFDCRDLPVGAGEPVAFVIAAGPGGGVSFISCECDSVVVLTDATGTAEVTLRAGTRSGTVVVRARSLSNEGVAAHSPVAIAAGPPASLAAGVVNCNVLACDIVAAENEITALVYDIYHNPVRDGTAVYFTTKIGMVRGSSGLGSATTVGGIVKGTWYSTGECGIDSVRVSTLGGGVANTVSFIASGLADSVGFLAPPGASVALNADGASILPLRVDVRDENGKFVLQTTPELELTPANGSVEIGATEDGCHASTARGSYTAPVLDRDRSYTPGDLTDDGIGGSVTVSVSAPFGSIGDQFQIVLHTGPASVPNSLLDIETSMLVGTQSYFTITIKDLWGNPLGGHRLSITTPGTVPGCVAPDEGVTDSYGMIGGLSFTAPAAAGTVNVEVRDLDPALSGNLILRASVTVAP